MPRHVRSPRPSPALAIALLALFVSLGGTAWAVATINGASIVDRTVAGKKLKRNAVRANEIGPRAVTPAKTGAVPAARVSFNDENHSVTSGMTTYMPFSAEEFDTRKLHKTGVNNERLRAPIAGVYLVTGELGWDNATAAGYRKAAIVKTTPTFQGEIAVSGGFTVVSGVFPRQGVSTITRLKPGNYVRLAAAQSSGGALNVRWANLTMVWLGP